MKFKFFTREKEPSAQSNTHEEIGVAGDVVFDGFQDALKRDDPHKISDYRKIRDTDGTAASLFSVVTLPILAATYGVRAAEDDEDEVQAEFIRKCLFEQPYKGGMEVPFSLVLEQMLHAVIDGFTVFERVYRVDDAGNVVLKKLALRDAETVQIRVDEVGGYNGIHQEATVGLNYIDVDIPAEKTFLFTYGKADSSLYGRSAYKSLYDNWDKKRKLEYLDSIAIQSSAITPKVMKRTDNSVIKDSNGETPWKKALKSLATLGKLKSVASLPYGFDVTELKGGDNSRINESIERQNSEMARAFLATFSLLGSQGSSSVGSYALSADQTNLFMIALKGTMNLIADHINQYWIADLIDRNFPTYDRHYPEFYFDDLTEETTEFLKAVFTKLIEKDKVSDELVAGITEKIKSKFEIEEQEAEAPTESPPEETEEIDEKLSKMVENCEKIAKNHENGKNSDGKEGDGGNASKFRRELREGEAKVNWKSLEKQAEKVSSKIEKTIVPMLDELVQKISKNPGKKVELPKKYLDFLEDTYANAYNYGKLAASDEEGQKAPKTTKEEAKHTEAYLDFIKQKQVTELESILAAQKLKRAVAEESPLLDTLANWATQTVQGLRESLFGYASNAGRSDAFKKFDEDDDAVYMWSALLENSCSVCEALDGTVLSAEEKEESDYQPGDVHLNCHCIWVRMSGNKKPEAEGLPDDIDEVYHIQTTPKETLRKEGVIKGDETKANASRALEFNSEDNGDTLDEVEKSIRGNDTEILAVFDDKGNKIVDYTSGEASAVSVRMKDFEKYLKDNHASISVHNHPGGRSFSDTDIVSGIRQNLDEIRVVAKNATYSLRPGENGWPEDVDALVKFYDEELGRYSDIALLRVKAGKVKPGIDNERWIFDQTVSSVAKKFDLLYNVSKE